MANTVNSNTIQERLLAGNVCLGKAGLAITTGGTAATFKSSAVTVAVGGVLYTVGATTAQAFSSGHTALASGDICYFVVCANTSGALSTVQGPIFKTILQNGVTKYADKYWDLAAPQSQTAPYPSNGRVEDNPARFLPTIDDSLTAIGIIKITATAAFTPGTTNLDNVATYTDVLVLPATL